MKLISCYIENFGNINRREFAFDGALTSFCENNGYGKTTLAAFLKAMFYGLKTTTARDKELGERARYYPFGGGKFGGNVTFEKGGATYKIERFFDVKSETKDTFALYKDGYLVRTDENYSAGREFFGIDEQSFLKTAFINAFDTDGGGTADIGKMLSGFVDDADYEAAEKALDKRKKEYKAERGGNGLIKRKSVQIAELDDKIKNLQKISDNLDVKYKDLAALTGEIFVLESGLEKQRERALLLQKWETYDGYKSDAERARKELDALRGNYPFGMPTAQEAEVFRRAADEEKHLGESLSGAGFPPESAEKLAALEKKFACGVPSDEDMRGANARAADIIRLGAEADSCKKLLDGVKAVEFPAGIPDEAEVEKYGKMLAASRDGGAGRAVKSKKATVISAICAVALLLAGAGLMFVNAAVGGAVLGVGALGALACVFIYFKGQINGLKRGAGDKENEVASFLVRCGYFSGAGAEVDFNNLTRDLREAREKEADRERYKTQLDSKLSQMRGEQEALTAFLEKYACFGSDAREELTRLGALSAEYAVLNAQKAQIESSLRENKARLAERKKITETFRAKYFEKGCNALPERVARDAAEAERLERSAKELSAKAEGYAKQNALETRPEADADGDCAERLAALNARKNTLVAEIMNCEQEIEPLKEHEESLKIAKAQEKELRKEYELLEKAYSLMKQAEDNLNNRYVAPIRDVFIKYGAPLENALGEKVILDKDFNVKFERGGEQKSDGHLSAGQKSLCVLCLRLALIENMYGDEAPFIILDDPFVHLDAAHMARAGRLIRELASSRQIIYFCCHESRKI